MNNLQYYYKVQEQLRQWLPDERITRLRNMALLIIGLPLSGAVHLSLIVRKWPVAGKDPSLVNRLWRFLNNGKVNVRQWYEPMVVELVQSLAGQPIRLVIDCTKVGFNYRLMTIGLAYKRRTLPLAWSVHQGGKGHTTAATQLKLFKYVARLLPKQAEIWVLGDTGFQSVHLLGWLGRQDWHFVIRQQGKNKVCWPGQDWIKINQLALQPGQTCYIGWVRLTQKHDAGWFWLILHGEKVKMSPGIWSLIALDSVP